MGEIAYTKYLTKELKRCNAEVWTLSASARQSPGIPDRYISHAYWVGWVEFKGVNTPTKPLQRRFIRFANRLHLTAVIVREGGRIEDHNNELLAEFDNSGLGLLQSLQILSRSFDK